MGAVGLQHQPYPWDGGYRCERCFQNIHNAASNDTSPCEVTVVEPWAIALSHPAGYGDRKHLNCVRCGDLLPASAEAGEPIATTIFRKDAGSVTLLISASYARLRIECSPPCTGLGSG